MGSTLRPDEDPSLEDSTVECLTITAHKDMAWTITTGGEITAIGTDVGATIKTSKAMVTHLDTMITLPGHKTTGAMEVPTAGAIMAIGTDRVPWIGVTIKASETTITGHGTIGGGKITENPRFQNQCGEVT